MTIATAFYSTNMDTVTIDYTSVGFNVTQGSLFGKFSGGGSRGDVITAKAQQLQISNGDYVQNYYGNFIYGLTGLISGSIDKADFYEFGKKTYEFSAAQGVSFDALTVKEFFDNKQLSKVEQYIFGENDVLNGSPESDVLRCFTGNDLIYGNGGDDLLKGENGNDTLIGGLGKDILIGGNGSDVFKFNALNESGLTANSRDIIIDFATKQDKLDLSALDANAALRGNDAFTTLKTGAFTAFAANTRGQLQFDSATHILYANTDADSAAEFSVRLTGVDTLPITSLIV